MKRFATTLFLLALVAPVGRTDNNAIPRVRPAAMWHLSHAVKMTPESTRIPGWGWMDVWVWPDTFDNPYEPITVSYYVDGMCEMEDSYFTWLLGVYMTGSDGASGFRYDWSGSFLDSAWKPRSNVDYTVTAYLACGDWNGPNYEYMWSVTQQATSVVQLKIARVQYIADYSDFPFFPMPGQTCQLTNEQDGFTFEHWIQTFMVLDQWGSPYDEPFWVWEDYIDEQPWEYCDYDWYPQGWELRQITFYDYHAAPHPKFCSECSCLTLLHNHWLGNPSYGFESLEETDWFQTCFGHTVNYVYRKSY